MKKEVIRLGLSGSDLKGVIAKHPNRYVILASATLYLFCALISINYSFNGVISQDHGDPYVYFKLAESIYSQGLNQDFDGYYVSRLLPSLMVVTLLHALEIDFSSTSLYYGFVIQNLITYLVTIFLLQLICKSLRFSLFKGLIAQLSLCLSFAVSSQSWGAPILTDSTALILGVLAFYCYFNSYSGALFFLAIPASFTWPFAGVSCLILATFVSTPGIGCRPLQLQANLCFSQIGRMLSRPLIRVMIISSILIIFLINIFSISSLFGFNKVIGVTSLITGLVSASIVILFCFQLAPCPFPRVEKKYFYIIFEKYRTTLLRALFSVIIYISISIFKHSISSSYPASLSLVGFVLPPAGKILLPFITLIMFWGVWISYIFFNFRVFSGQIRRIGLGAQLVVLLYLPTILVTEPRFLTFVIPFMLISAMRVVSVRMVMTNLSTLIVFQLLFSMPFLGLIRSLNVESLNIRSVYDFLYSNHYGLWMDWGGFFLYGIFVIILVRKLYLTDRNDRNFL